MSFENLIPLFSYNTHNRGIIRMDLDEAKYLYDLIQTISTERSMMADPSMKYYIDTVEIGTYKGGSTKLLLEAGAKLTTVDNYSSKTFDDYDYHPSLDVLKLCCENQHNLTLIAADTRTYDTTGITCDVLFIDGNHSYEGVKADYENWIETLSYNDGKYHNGGHLLFHDACIAREGATGNSDVIKFLKELKWKKVKEVGSLVHFIKVKNDEY